MRFRHSNKSDWHLASDLVGLKSAYLDQIENLAHEYQSRMSICKCRSCGFEFLTAKSNFRRSDLLCVFGCRKRHEKSSSKARSRKRNQTVEGKEKKKILNRRRSERGDETPAPQPRASITGQLRYYRWLIWLIDGVRLNSSELAAFILSILEKVRSRGLLKSRMICDVPDS